MHMVRRQLPSLNLAFTLPGQTVKNLTQMMAKGFIKHLPAVLRDEHKVNLAIPFRMD